MIRKDIMKSSGFLHIQNSMDFLKQLSILSLADIAQPPRATQSGNDPIVKRELCKPSEEVHEIQGIAWISWSIVL